MSRTPVPVINGLVTCNCCNEAKPETDFYTAGGRLMRPCKSCRSEQKRRGLVGLSRIGGKR